MVINAAEYLLSGRSSEPDKPAIVADRETMTYRTLAARVGAFAAALSRAGMPCGARVVFLMDDTADLVACYLGAMFAGGISVLVSSRSTQSELQSVLTVTRPFLIVADATVVELHRSLLARLGLDGRLILRASGAQGLEMFIDTQAPQCRPTTVTDQYGAFWVFSSGTTGAPKAIEHRHSNVQTCEDFPAAIGLSSRDVFLPTSRLHFAYSLGLGLFGALRLGATTVLMEAWPTAASVRDTIARHKPTALFSVPLLYWKLVEGGAARDPAFSRVRRFVSAGERLSPGMVTKWKQATGMPIYDGMGCSETIYMVFGNTPDALRPGSSGHPMKNVEVRLVDRDGHVVQSPDIEGALEIRMPSLCAGYPATAAHDHVNLSRPAESFRPDGWYASGDLYVRDRDGFYHHRGRRDDMMRVHGQWVSPTEVEDAARQNPEVADAAAVCTTGPAGLSEIHLYIVPVPACHHNIVLRAVQECLATRLQRYKRPRQVFIIDQLPRTATGKVQRYRLRNRG